MDHQQKNTGWLRKQKFFPRSSWASKKTFGLKRLHAWLYLIVAVYSLMALTGCALTSVSAQQEKASGLWNELVYGQAFGQTFVAGQDNIYRVDLGTATYARINSASVIFHLRADPDSVVDLRTITLSGQDVANDRPTSFIFDPIPDSQGKPYYFFIESPDSVPGNAITLYAQEADTYLNGSAYRNGQPVPGDLVFTVYTQEIYTFSDLVGDFWTRLTQDKAFLFSYVAILLMIVIGLICTVRIAKIKTGLKKKI